jgi:hypothetical protein
MQKKPWVSKTVLVNSLTLIGSLVAVVSGSDLIQEYPQAIAVLGAVASAVNIGLRFLTSVPLSLK